MRQVLASSRSYEIEPKAAQKNFSKLCAFRSSECTPLAAGSGVFLSPSSLAVR